MIVWVRKGVIRTLKDSQDLVWKDRTPGKGKLK